MVLSLRCLLLSLAAALLLSAGSVPARAASDIIGSATVLPDGTLRVSQYWIRLYGVYIPESGQQCRTFVSPVYCGTRAAVALDTHIQGFVFCQAVSRNADDSVNAFCTVGRTFYSSGDDLGAYLIIRGLALAGPDAPFEYVALERIAQTRGAGIWGFRPDVIIRR